jgi:hypothetical protein
MSDRELWQSFLELVRLNLRKLGDDVAIQFEDQPPPYIVQWGDGRTYEFDPERARHQGLAVSVIAAVNQIRAPLRTSGSESRREQRW